MAVYAAHLTRTLGGAPSVFQAAAQDALADTLKPALRRLAQYLVSENPERARWLDHCYDELYLLFDCCLQYHYLKHYAASFSESFYGLVRVATAPAEFGCARPRLPPSLERASLALLVLAPYLRDKVERVVERWRAQDEDGTLGKSTSALVRRAAIKVYSFTHLAVEGAKLVQLARYVCGGARAHSPSLALLGLALHAAPPPEPQEHSWGELARSVMAGRFGSAAVTFPMVGALLLRLAEHGAFAVQFLRWWAARGALAERALPPPPPPQRTEQSVRYRNKCPLCLQPWRTPTALAVSGYIFCYACVSRHVRAHATCPVTGAPVTERGLVRLYLDA